MMIITLLESNYSKRLDEFLKILHAEADPEVFLKLRKIHRKTIVSESFY